MLINAFGRLVNLVSATPAEISAAGVADVEAVRLAATFELARRARRLSPGTPITSPASAAEALLPHLAEAVHERVLALALDGRSGLIAEIVVSEGGLDRAQIDPRLLFGRLLKASATSVIIGHNHPSGSPEPSRFDVTTTRRLTDAANILQIDLVDHLVVAGERWVSMKQEGLIEAGERAFDDNYRTG